MTPTPILALHGTASNAKQWRGLQQSMAAERRVLTPDLPGYGEFGTADLPATPGMERRLRSICELLDILDEPCHVVGHSFGGALALRLGVMRPEQVLSISVYEPTALAVFHGCTQPLDQRFLGEFRRLGQITASATPEVAMESFVNYWMGPGQWTQLSSANQNILTAVAKSAARDFQDALLDLDQPTPPKWYAGPVQILCGDSTVPASHRIAHLLMERLPNASLQIMSGAGHMGPMTHGHDFHTAYRAFLRQLENDSESQSVAECITANCA
ncbi:MAG: alpha/beta fold hydrolase [Pseudomonadota bacterium]